MKPSHPKGERTMLKQLLSDNRIFSALVCVLVFIAGGLLYLQTVKQEGRRAVQRTQEIVEQRQTPKVEESAPPKPPPPGETSESGHWHGDVWHAEPHDTPVKPPTPVRDLPSSEAPGALVGAASTDAQILEQAEQEGNIRLFDKRTEEYHKAVKAWQDWHKKFDELNAQFFQAGDEMIDALPETEAEAKRYENDENAKKELGRKVTEAAAKSAKIGAALEAHEAKKPPFPYIK